MFKKLLSASSLYALTNAFLSASKLILLPIYVRYLSTEQYGILGYVNTVTLLFSIFVFFGLDRAVSREYFDYHNDQKELKSYLFTVFLFMLLLNITVIVLTFLFGPWIFRYFIGNEQFFYYPYIPLSLGISIVTSFYGISMVLLQVQEKAIKYVIFQITKFLLVTSLILLLVIKWHFETIGVLVGELVGTAVITLILIYFLLSELFHLSMNNLFLGLRSLILQVAGMLTIAKTIRQIFNGQKLRHTLAFGVPFVILDMGNWLTSGVGRFILSKYRNFEEVGFYTLGDTLAFGLNMIMSAFYTAYLPFFFKTAKEHIQPQKLFAMIADVYVFVIGGSCLMGMLFSNEIIACLAPPIYKPASTVMRILIIAMFALGLHLITTLPLLYLKETKILLVFLLASGVINVGMNFILTPSMGMVGTALSKTVAQVIMFLFSFWITSRKFPIKYSMVTFWGMIALFIGAGLLFHSQQLYIRVLICVAIFASGGYINYNRLMFVYAKH